MPGPVLFLGTGATKSRGGPLTNAIPPAIDGRSHEFPDIQ